MVEQSHRIGNVQRFVVVDIGSIAAGKFRSAEKMEDDLHRITDIDPSISVRITPNELGRRRRDIEILSLIHI